MLTEIPPQAFADGCNERLYMWLASAVDDWLERRPRRETDEWRIARLGLLLFAVRYVPMTLMFVDER